jgi:hypothetical protein
MTTGNEPAGLAGGRISLEDAMDVLLAPVVDLVTSIKYSGLPLLRILLEAEFQRGYAAGLAANAPAAAPLRVRLEQPSIRIGGTS